jgi:hypothetical protein
MQHYRAWFGAIPARSQREIAVEMCKGFQTELSLHAPGDYGVKIFDPLGNLVAEFGHTNNQIGTDFTPTTTNMYRVVIKNESDLILDYRLEVIAYRSTAVTSAPSSGGTRLGLDEVLPHI